MAIQKLNLEQSNQAQEQQNPLFLLDSLYCEEEKWFDEDQEDEEIRTSSNNNNNNNTRNLYLSSFLLSDDQDLVSEDEEILYLLTKEQEQSNGNKVSIVDDGPSLCLARKEAVNWILKVNARFGFSTLTAVLAINYLDRFINSFRFQNDKPWMIQLVSVTCLSLAAKVEETHVPLLIDLQVEVTKYVFEPKTIQRMELLVMSTLKWKMHPITPISYFDHVIRRLGLKTHFHWDFLKRSESLLISLISDSRFVRFPPSVLATATMMSVIDQVEPLNPIDYQNQLVDVIKITKEKVSECCDLIHELSTRDQDDDQYVVVNKNTRSPLKRKYNEIVNRNLNHPHPHPHPNGSSVETSSVSPSSTTEHVFKKNRASVSIKRALVTSP